MRQLAVVDERLVLVLMKDPKAAQRRLDSNRGVRRYTRLSVPPAGRRAPQRRCARPLP